MAKKFGTFTGTVVEYTPTGQVVKTETFVKGEKVSVKSGIVPTGSGGTIPPEKAEQYRREEQELYKKVGYTGAKTYAIPYGATREQIITARQKAKVIPTSPETRQVARQRQFTGKVAEYEPDAEEPTKTRFFIRGRETGRVEGEAVAVTQPSRFVFQRGSAEETVDLIFGDEGESIMRSTEIQTISPDTSLPITEQVTEEGRSFSGFSKTISEDIKSSYTYGEFGTKFIQNIRQNVPSLYSVGEKVYTFARGYPVVAGFTLGETRKGLRAVAREVDVKKLELHGVKPTEMNIQRVRQYERPMQQIVGVLVMGAFVSPRALGYGKYRVTEPLRKAKKPVAFEKTKTYIEEGKPPKTVSEYRIITEKQPPRVAYTTSTYRKMVGKTPKEIKYLPPKTTVTTTPFGATAEQTFTVMQRKIAGRPTTAMVSGVAGTSRRLNVLRSGLSTPEKYLVRQLAEYKAGGRPVTDRMLSKFYARERTRYISDIDVEKYFKLYRTPKVIVTGKGVKTKAYDWYPRGKAVKRYKAITEIEVLGETDLYRLTRGETLFKDVTYPLAKARGKTPSLTTYALEYKKPIIVGTGKKAVDFIRPAQIQKTPLSKTFQAQIQKPILYPPPPTPKAQPYTKAVSPAVTTEVMTSRVSIYAGKGLYERTEGGLTPPAMKQLFVQTPAVTPTITQTQTPTVTQISTQVTRLTQPQIFKQRQAQIQTQTPFQKVIQTPKQIPMQKQIPKQAQKLMHKQILTQKLITKTPPPTPITPPPTPPPRTPTISKPFRFPKIETFKVMKTPQAKIPVLMRRFGKFRVIGYGRTPSQAFKIGQEATRRTLGATFKVPSVPQPEKILGYRRKITKKGVLFIELPKFRLSTPSEVKEIQYYRAIRGLK